MERADHDHGLAQQEHHGGGEVAAASGGRPPPTEAVTTNINWYTSPFYLGNFFSKQPDNKSAKCNSCPISSASIKTKSGNTTGLDSHLSRKHRNVYETFLIKKAEVEAKRKEIQEKSKRKLGQDLFQTKQSKLKTKDGILDMKRPPPDPKIQKEFTDAVVNMAVETGISFNALSGPAFRNVVDVLN